MGIVNHRQIIGSFFVLVLGWCWIQCQNQAPTVSYNKDIRPIFNNKCIGCHGGVKASGGFSLLFEETAKGPTESGRPAIIPGSSQKSELYLRLITSDEEKRMPHKEAALPDREIELIRQWIDQGAKWEKHWAFIPPKPITDWPKSEFPHLAFNEIDSFVFSQLAKLNLAPKEAAPSSVLLRRLYLDVIGLPPTFSDYQRFRNNSSVSAFEEEVDRLLARPEFGEKWASFWLDLARYADSKGYEKDLPREIWKYRDYVVEALNQDIGFDQFTLQQLAGDLMEQPTESSLIATAFHRNSMVNDEGGTDDEEFRVAGVLERVGTTFQVWQAVTMECVQCHSHPYDPITHEEFYESMAIFNNTADKDLYNEQPKWYTYESLDTSYVHQLLDYLTHYFDQPRSSLHSLPEQKRNLFTQLDFLKIEAEEFQDKSRFIELVGHDQKSIWQVQDSSWIFFEQLDLTDIESIDFSYASNYGGVIEIRVDQPLGRKLGEVKLDVTETRFERNRPQNWRIATAKIQPTEGYQNVYFYFRKDKRFAQDLLRLDWFFLNKSQPLYAQAPSETIDKLWQLEAVPTVTTPIFQELKGAKRRKTFVFDRGDWRKPTAQVSPKVPDILGGELRSDFDRKDFAAFLMSDDNPLTARVFVNRIWEQIFGFGLVETMEDFGSQGSAPTHPELLDWLALEFKDEMRWKIKPLIKKIVMSATYQQSSAVDSVALEKDPYNKYLSRGSRTRLSAEVIRDQALYISGLLSNKLGGPSVMPPQPESIVAFGGRFWTESEGEDRYRRSLYTYWKRTNAYPTLMTFDQPSREVCTSRRIRTNTPLQALVLLNDPVYVEAAEATAKNILAEYPNQIEQGIKDYLYLVLADKSPEKEKIMIDFYRESLGQYNKQFTDENQEQLALTLVVNAMFNLDEFVTRR